MRAAAATATNDGVARSTRVSWTQGTESRFSPRPRQRAKDGRAVDHREGRAGTDVLMLLRGSACGDEAVPATVWGALAELGRRKLGIGQQAGRRRATGAVTPLRQLHLTAPGVRRWDAFAVQAKVEQKAGAEGSNRGSISISGSGSADRKELAWPWPRMVTSGLF